MELVHVGWGIHTSSHSHKPFKVQPEPGIRRKGKESKQVPQVEVGVTILMQLA